MNHMAEGRCTGQIDWQGEVLHSVVVKETFRIQGSSLVPSEEPEPILEGEAVTRPAGEGGPQIPVRLPDRVPIKYAPDLVVLATARAAPAVTEAEVTLEVGDLARLRLRLFGPRSVTPCGSELAFTPPVPFEELPLTWDRAYGGVDEGYPVPDFTSAQVLIQSLMWHPGTYPRNSLGTGFKVQGTEGEIAGLSLPCVELPDDLLTPRRLLCPEISRWHLQPRPAGFGWCPGEWFPRCVFLGIMPGPWPDLEAGEVTEEQQGLIPPGTTAAMRGKPIEQTLHPGYFQEAAPGLTLPGLERVEGITLHGLDNGRPVHLEIPRERPAVAICLPGRELRPPLHLLTLLLDLDGGVAIRLWAGPTVLQGSPLAEIKDEELMALPVRLDYVSR